MPDFEDSTLWNVSAFERQRSAGAASAFQRPDGPTLLPTTLLADLRRLHADPSTDDVVEVVAACLRHREAALLYLQHEQVVWPVTLFPAEGLVHSPRDMATQASLTGLATLKLIGEEPPGLRPPGHHMHERVAPAAQYRLITPWLLALALNGPRSTVLAEIGGRAAYRLAPGRAGVRPHLPGALAAAATRLHTTSASLRDIARWPGMSLERASRLLNALYLTGTLMVTRSHPSARDEPARSHGLFGRKR